MRRTDVYVKVELIVNERDDIQKISYEIVRQIQRVHEVRAAEVLNVIDRE